MASLTFRARAIDMAKPLPVLLAKDIPDLTEATSVQRALPQMATGMDKEEEEEHHIQVVINAQQLSGSVGPVEKVIPTPAANVEAPDYRRFYSSDFTLPKHYVLHQDRYVSADIIDYDLDTDDEQWLSDYNKNVQQGTDSAPTISELKLESMLDRLESVTINDNLLSLEEARSLLKEDDKLTQTVYFYWKEKRLQRNNRPLRPTVKTDSRYDIEGHLDPYVAFRRRADKQKIQTRKNRQRDEIGYERMLKLKRDMDRARALVEMVKKREKVKRELMVVALEVFQKRYETNSWDVPAPAARETDEATYHSDLDRSPSKFKKPKIKGVNGNILRPGKVGVLEKRPKHGHYTTAHDVDSDGTKGDGSTGPDGTKSSRKLDFAFPFKRKRSISYCQGAGLGMPTQNSDFSSRFAFAPLQGCSQEVFIGRVRIGRGGRRLFDRTPIHLAEQYRNGLAQPMDLSNPQPIPILTVPPPTLPPPSSPSSGLQSTGLLGSTGDSDRLVTVKTEPGSHGPGPGFASEHRGFPAQEPQPRQPETPVQATRTAPVGSSTSTPAQHRSSLSNHSLVAQAAQGQTTQPTAHRHAPQTAQQQQKYSTAQMAAAGATARKPSVVSTASGMGIGGGGGTGTPTMTPTTRSPALGPGANIPKQQAAATPATAATAPAKTTPASTAMTHATPQSSTLTQASPQQQHVLQAAMAAGTQATQQQQQAGQQALSQQQQQLAQQQQLLQQQLLLQQQMGMSQAGMLPLVGDLSTSMQLMQAQLAQPQLVLQQLQLQQQHQHQLQLAQAQQMAMQQLQMQQQLNFQQAQAQAQLVAAQQQQQQQQQAAAAAAAVAATTGLNVMQNQMRRQQQQMAMGQQSPPRPTSTVTNGMASTPQLANPKSASLVAQRTPSLSAAALQTAAAATVARPADPTSVAGAVSQGMARAAPAVPKTNAAAGQLAGQMAALGIAQAGIGLANPPNQEGTRLPNTGS